MSSHITPDGRPHMVNVGEKEETKRRAVAIGMARFPGLKKLSSLTSSLDIDTAKGPMFQTAIVAGIMAAKRTSSLIPLCHPLRLTHCDIEIHPVDAPGDDLLVEVRCTVETRERTGVEMEALTGVSVALLTLYDMGKSMVKGIELGPISLLEKIGGKSGMTLP